jgi:hypothetical protein
VTQSVVDPLAPYLVFEGISRSVLEERIRTLIDLVHVLERRNEAEYLAMSDNLAATQGRCTELLTEVRAYRASGICLPGWWCLCGGFNGGAREILKLCRFCERPKPGSYVGDSAERRFAG